MGGSAFGCSALIAARPSEGQAAVSAVMPERHPPFPEEPLSVQAYRRPRTRTRRTSRRVKSPEMPRPGRRRPDAASSLRFRVGILQPQVKDAADSHRSERFCGRAGHRRAGRRRPGHGRTSDRNFYPNATDFRLTPSFSYENAEGRCNTVLLFYSKTFR